MRRTGKLPELLAPAGSEEALYAAVAAGADAVYLGGKAFGARAYAKNFDTDALKRALTYCHLHGVCVYVTVNTLLYDKEMDEAVAFVRSLYAMGVDAVISADLGLIAKLRRELPQMPIHASTQMSLHNRDGVDFASKLGISRAVLARELSKEDIAFAVENSESEIEVFLHGALCVCHSGQCLFSSLVGGRSGNRGECAQPCRLPYNGAERYPLSLKDCSLSHHVRELCDIGVASLKIEGRMKSPSYVYEVTSVYRRLLDEYREATAKDDERLERAFSRSGFTDGYFAGHPEKPMTGIRTAEDKADSKNAALMTFAPTKIPVRAVCEFHKGEPSKMTLIGEKKTVSVTGESPSEALTSPLNISDLTTRLCKMGNTFLSLDEKDVEIHLDDGVNLPISAINALRRNAAEAYEDTSRVLPNETQTLSVPKRPKKSAGRTAVFYSRIGFDGLSKKDLSSFSQVFLPLFLYEKKDAEMGVSGVCLPPVVFDSQLSEVKVMLARAKEYGAKAALVSNPSHIALAEAFGLLPFGDFRLNVCNRETAAFYGELEGLVLSPELTLPMMRDIGGSAIVYGRIPLMLTERCFVKENGGCDHCMKFGFTDRVGKRFPVIREYPHRNLILNAVVTYMGDRQDDYRKIGLSEHFLFTVETSDEIRRVLRAFDKREKLPFEVRRIQK